MVRGRRMRLALLGAAGAGALLSAGTVQAAANPCSNLLNSNLPNVRIISADQVDGKLPAEILADSQGQDRNGDLTRLPSFCRVRADLSPVAGSHIGVELWLPQQWNGKLLGFGNHGFGGEYERGYMAMGVNRGYAVVTTDTGHVSRNSGTQVGFNVGNAEFALDNPVAVEDFAWRAIHEMTVAAKSLTLLNYGSLPRRAYFAGCSTGGRQAMREVQQFPDDYDGVIAGGAPMQWTRVIANGLNSYQIGGLPSGLRMTQAKLVVAQRAAVSACDKLDGLADNLIADPSACRWDPKSVLCKPGVDPATCLTDEEVAAVVRAETPLKDRRTGEVFYAAMPPGSESHWRLMLQFNAVTSNHFKYLVTKDPAWAPRADSDLWALVRQSEQPGAPALSVNTVEPDISAFRARGGKLIHYHGWNDEAMPAGYYPDYYDKVVALQPGDDKLAQTQSFYRLFMVPGMTHCRDGDGPVQFGAPRQIASPTRNADHDILEALDRWVESGTPPTRLVATEFDADGKQKRQMPLCPWPQVAIYSGGAADRAESFSCRARASGTR